MGINYGLKLPGHVFFLGGLRPTCNVFQILIDNPIGLLWLLSVHLRSLALESNMGHQMLLERRLKQRRSRTNDCFDIAGFADILSQMDKQRTVFVCRDIQHIFTIPWKSSS